MQIAVSGKNFDITEALKAHAENRLSRLSRYFDHLLSASVHLSTERSWHIVEVTLFGKGMELRGEERSKDMYHSIDSVVDKLERQIKKQKGKVIHRERSQDGRSERGAGDPGEQVVQVSRPEVETLYEARVDTLRSYVAEPMSLEQAIKEMEEAGQPFQAFLSEESGRIQVVYKSERGYGLVDPRLED